jgi:hypothetical protein
MREPDFDELIGTEAGDAERERLRGVHELLVQAGPPPELTPQLRKTPTFGGDRLDRRRTMKRRATLLLAAALAATAVFAAGFAVADHRGGGTVASVVETVALRGTSAVPKAQATLEVWRSREGNWPMTLNAIGLPALPRHTYYEVYLVRQGALWGSCGTFRVASASRAVSVTLNAPYPLRPGDSWVVIRAVPGKERLGDAVLRPVRA